MGPYCKFCDRRCFVPRVIPSTGKHQIMATCAAGAAHDRAVTGYDHSTATNPRANNPLPSDAAMLAFARAIGH